MFAFLRAIGLKPLEWTQALALTKQGAPYIGEILDAAFSEAQAVIALFTGDDEARLRETSLGGPQEALTPQARPNVIFEAGMAMGRCPDRTVFVEIGILRPFSDIAGRHVIRFDGRHQTRHALAKRLRLVGCEVNTVGSDWHEAGEFEK
ncbi:MULTISPECIES: TIR domain-containing protein [Myxococcus]|uniref:TIR domain-containing protein n=1 Tax=Myxococcus TaxID=32 RepID=UPI001EF05B19|nr:MULTISPECIES: nucleotide-binding protein [Myxococcus]